MDQSLRSIRRIMLLGLAALVVIAIALPSVWRWRLANEVESRLATIRTAGLPTSGAELDKWYAAVPDTENAAVVMTQAFALMCNFPDGRSNEIARINVPPRNQRLGESETRLIADYVEMNSGALAKAREVASLPKARYPVDFALGLETPLPHLAKLKSLAHAAAFQAALALDSGLPADATAALIEIFSMAQTLEEEPCLISQLVRIALIATAEAALERRANAADFSDRELDLLQSSLAIAEKTNLVVRAFIGERAVGIPYFRMSWSDIKRYSKSDEDDPERHRRWPESDRQPAIFRLSGFFERDLLYFLKIMGTNITFAGQPPPASLAARGVFEQAAIDGKTHFYILSSMLLPAMSKAVVTDAGCFARLRLAKTAVAVERFRLANGRYPDSMEEVVPGFISVLPTDPFSGQPLRYKRIAKGYVVYSVGADGRDDGGRERPARTKSTDTTSYDVTFAVER